MARISLRDYNREIERLIEGGHNDEAIAHCRYILQAFPKHVDTYRLLGKALLESQRYGDAADILQRVLSSVPDDFIGHLGMSIIREEQGDLNTSLWHMERAFEVQPANNVIQEELKRLFKQRDGVEPARIQLTRGALARMYIKGDLHAQAIAELRAALAEDSERPDLLVLLARAYQRAGQRVEAAETASQLAIKLPYCLEANRILAEILVGTERASEAEIYRKRVIALDPYYAYLPDGARSADQTPDGAVTIERYVYVPGEPRPIDHPGEQEAALASAGGELPSWLSEIESEAQKPEISPAEFASWERAEVEGPAASAEDFPGEPAPGVQAETPAEPAVEEAPEIQPEIAPPSPEPASGQDMVPDWLRNAGWEQAEPESETPPAEMEASALEGSLAGAGPSEGSLSEESPSEGELFSAEIPDWLRPLAPKETQESQTPDAGAIPMPWLEGEQAGETGQQEGVFEDQGLADQGGEPMAAGSQGDLPDWLQPAADQPAEPEQPAEETEEEISWPISTQPEEPFAQEQELPEWLRELPDEPLAAPVDDLNLWLPEESQPEGVAEKEEPPSQSEPARQPAPEEQPAGEVDWLRDASLTAYGAGAAGETAAREPAQGEAVEPAGEAEGPAAEAPFTEETPSQAPAGELDWSGDAGLAAFGAGAVGESADVEAAEPEDVQPGEAEEEPALESPFAEGPATQVPAGELDWLRQASSIGERPAGEAAGPEAAPPGIEPEEPALEAEFAEETPSQAPAGELDWLRSTEMEAVDLESAVEEPSSEGPVVEEPAAEEMATAEPGAGEPDRLKARSEAEDIPDWLKTALGAVEEPAAQAVPPAQAGFPEEPPHIEGDTKPIRVSKTEAEFQPAETQPAETQPGESLVEEVPSEVLSEAAQEAPAPPPAAGLAEEAEALPDWLRPEAEADGAPQTAEIEAEPETPEVAGAETPPDWLRPEAELAGEPPAAEIEAESETPEVAETETLPDWLRPEAELAGEPPAAEIEAQPEAHVAEETEPLPDWLRSTASTFEPSSEAPATEPPAAEAPAAGFEAAAGAAGAAPEDQEGTPDWLRTMAEQLEAPPEEAPPEVAPPELAPPAVEEGMEAATGEEFAAAEMPSQELPATPELTGEVAEPDSYELEEKKWIQEWMQAKAAQFEETVELESPAEPVVAESAIAESATAEAVPAETVPEEAPPAEIGAEAPLAEELAAASSAAGPADLQPAEMAQAAPLEVEAGMPAEPQDALARARTALFAGESEQALKQYGELIQQEQDLDQVIQDLREATFRFPIDVSLYQALGDAYLRSGQLQEALDAYNKAEELLR